MAEFLLSPTDAAKAISVSPKTLANWRTGGIGPAFVKLGRGIRARVAYRPQDLDEWILGQRRESTSTTEPPNGGAK